MESQFCLTDPDQPSMGLDQVLLEFKEEIKALGEKNKCDKYSQAALDKEELVITKTEEYSHIRNNPSEPTFILTPHQLPLHRKN